MLQIKFFIIHVMDMRKGGQIKPVSVFLRSMDSSAVLFVKISRCDVGLNGWKIHTVRRIGNVYRVNTVYLAAVAIFPVESRW